MQTKVEICGVNTSGLPVLSAKKTDELLKKSAAGDKQARDELIRGNLRLVLSVVQRFQGRGESPDDLFQVGCIGLMKAIDNFNTELGVRFSTYAVPMIIGEIRRYLRDNSAMRVSRSLRDTAYRALQAKEAFIREHQRGTGQADGCAERGGRVRARRDTRPGVAVRAGVPRRHGHGLRDGSGR